LYLLKESSKKKQIDTGEFDSKKLHNKEVKMIEDCDIILTAYTQPMPILKFIERSGKTVIDLLPKQESTDDEFNIPF
jgi:protein-tyrosine-phosphatase